MIYAEVTFDECGMYPHRLYFETHAKLDRYVRNRRQAARELIVIQWWRRNLGPRAMRALTKITERRTMSKNSGGG